MASLGIGGNETGTYGALMPTGLQPLLKDHSTLIFSGAVSLMVCLKLLSLSRYDSTTAMAVLQVAGTSQVIIATLISMLPMIAAVITLHVAFRYWHWLRHLSSVERNAIFAVVSPFLGLIIAMSPFVMWLGLGVALLLLLVLNVAVRLYKRTRKVITQDQKNKETAPSSLESKSAALIFPAMLLFATIQMPWLPLESVAIGNNESIPAYVVGERNDETAILPLGKGEALTFEPTATVTRRLCKNTSWLTMSVASAIDGKRYPDCPDIPDV